MPADLPLLSRVVIPSVLSGKVWSREFRLRHRRTGQALPVHATMFLLRNPGTGEPIALAAVCQDIEAKARAEAALRAQARFLQLLSDITGAALSQDSLDGILQVSVAPLAALIGADDCLILLHDEAQRPAIASAAWGASANRLLAAAPDPGEATMVDSVLRVGITLAADDVFDSPYIGPRVAAAYPSRSLLGVPLSAEGRILGVALFGFKARHRFTEAEMRRCEQAAGPLALTIARAGHLAEAQRLATTDDLTGVHNRRHLLALGEHEMRRAQRSRQRLSAIMLDIDHFKTVNDRFGHRAGDEVLRQVAQMCAHQVRAADIVGRYGGEEFVLLLPETDQATALRIAERLGRAVAASAFRAAGETVRITVSMGVAASQELDRELSALLRRADDALYEAKAAGRNFVVGSAGVS
jgi:diguanylate cyclase (GGDEF)-like protein